MKKLLVLVISVVFGMSMFFTYALPAMAAEGEGMMAGETCPLPSFSGPSHDSGYLGALAVDREYKDLGRVVDVLSTGGNDGWITFLVVSSCLPGNSGKLVAIPYTAADRHQAVGTVVTDVTQDDFQKAPTIASEMNGAGWNKWVQESYDYFAKTF